MDYSWPEMPPIDLAALENDLLLRSVWEGLGMPRSHVTGGYVRDRLLGKKSVDLDLVLSGAVEATAAPAKRLAARLDTRPHLLGQGANRVWRIETPGIRVELWPRGSLSLDQDIQRRDFTCNALVWYLPNGPLIDHVHGLDDLRSGTLRAVQQKNLEDDRVRLIRAARFLAEFDNFELDSRTAKSITQLAPTLRGAPRERVGQELLKLLRAPRVVTGVRCLLRLGLLEHAAPGEARSDRGWLEDNLPAAARLSGESRHPVPQAVRAARSTALLALLLRSWNTPGIDSIAAYAWPQAVRNRAHIAATLIEGTTTTVESTAAERRAFIHSAGSAFPAALAVAAAIEPQHPWRRWWRMWVQRGPELVGPEPLLSGEQIGKLLDLPPGPKLGRAVNALTAAQVAGAVRSEAGARRWLRNLPTEEE
jgi:tRNA nucleotidyltransferase/poly(A) polymerase